jgi:hypothetical protein
MPHLFKPYEVEVLKLLLAAEFSQRKLLRLLKHASAQSVEYTGYGFFVSIHHPVIGRARRVCDSPVLRGDFAGRIAGFVVFLEKFELTLETFPRDGDGALPAEFRDSHVRISLHVA